MKRFLSLVLTLFLLFSPTFSKDKKVSFDEQATWRYIKAMASDSMEGRKSGQLGGVKGEEYIASKFKEWRLEPAGDNDTYYQNFTIEHRHIKEGVALEIVTGRERRHFYFGEDWSVQRYSGSGHFTEEIIFAGYGIHAPDKGYDDYAGVDVKGKMVLISSNSSTKIQDKVGEETGLNERVEAAQELGARGVIVFRSSTAAQSRSSRRRLNKKLYKPDFVILSVEEKIPNFIFKDLKTDTRTLFRTIDGQGKSQALETGVKAFISVNAIFDEKRATRNVIAKITGSDKKLKDEYIVIGGHMDHLGIHPMGDVYNGANDNASGTAVVMEVARIMKLNKARPKRTVIFAAWAGEEQGLLGSRHYANHSKYPIERTIANINLDMVGHGSGKIPFNGVYYGPQVWKILEEKLPKEILDYVSPGRGGPGGSDHTPFLEKGIPAFFLITRGSIKYHQVRDESDLIKPEMLKKTGDLVHAAVKILASEPGNFIQPMRQENYRLKYQNIINYELSPLSHVIEAHGEAKDSHVKLQMAVVEEKEGLSGEALRVDIINSIFAAKDNIEESKGLSYYSSSRRLRTDVRQGKTTVIPGLKSMKAIQDDPKWAEVLAKMGLYYVVVDDSSFLFDDKGLNEEGSKIIDALNSSGLLLIIKGADAFQKKALLMSSKKPLVILDKELPNKEVLKLIKKKESALGLILGAKDDPDSFFTKFTQAKEAIGTPHLMIVNEICLWHKPGQTQMLKVISSLLKSKLEGMDLANIFSGTFLRVLDKAREGDS